MKKILVAALSVFGLLYAQMSFADVGVVVKRFSGCDYFIADGPKGLYVLEWFGGYDPDEGDIIIGDIGSYGMKKVYYKNVRREGKVWVEDYLESEDAAMEEVMDHCD